MTLADIKRLALSPEVESIEIMWDKIDSDPSYREDFETTVQTVVNSVAGLEFVYNHITNGQSIHVPDEPSPLSPAELLEAKHMVEDELFAAYQMVDLWDRYRAVNTAINNI